MTQLPEIEFVVLLALEPGKAASVEEVVETLGKLYPGRGNAVPGAGASVGMTQATSRTGDLERLGVTLMHDKLREDLGMSDYEGANQALVMAGAKLLEQRGWVRIGEEHYDEFTFAEPGMGVELSGKGRELFPERDALREILKTPDGIVGIAELSKLLGGRDVRSHVKWLLRRNWCSRQGEILVVTDVGRNSQTQPDPDESLANALAPYDSLTEGQLRAEGVDVLAAKKLLKGRDDIIKIRRRVRRRLTLTEAGKALKAAGIEPVVEVNQLTPRLLASGKWGRVSLRKYDPGLATAPKYPGKEHPLQRVIQEIRQAFFEMGFEEVASPTVDTAFWVFDALFQPQDHPAREMQDTFYVAEPKHGRLPDDKLVQAIARTHENGGDTGSTGWRYKWDIEKARQLVLRTHTTSASIRALAANPQPPRKVFCIGKTFRREATDQTHLAEFMQIDGIIIDAEATLATLFGTLEAFYRKMGAEEVRFRPSFFPYTEPSAEVFAKMGKLGWVEMCGSGVFRPEVTRPLGCTVPVLAWGGGVERIAMMRFGLDDIRKLYMADIDWLRNARLSG